jgi:sugar lactone lactonase YvrE
MQAQFAGPLGVSLDNRAKGGIYIADSLNNTIRRIDFNNRVSTILGNTTQGTMGDITPFEQSVLKTPQGVAVDPNGNLVIADTGNNAIYFADMSKKEVRLLAGNPATAGNKDGKGKEALFNLPTSISIQPAKSSFFASSNADLAILVADRGNGIIRVITFDGRVSTLGKIAKPSTEEIPLQGQSSDAFSFSNPKSVTSDNMGNIYVVDDNGVSVITSPNNRAERQRVSLAQPGSFTKATSLVIQGTSTLVLDMTAKEEEAIKVITIGKPVIDSLSAGIARIEGNQEIIIKGRNFAPETQIVLGDQLITDFKVVSAREISIRVPTQKSGGDRTLTVQTRGGMAQTRFTIVPKPLSELATNQITTIAGGIPYLGDGGLATSDVTSLSIFGVAMDGMGNIFFADDLNNRIRRIDANTGIITTIAGNGRADFSGDGELAISASLKAPSSLALDSQGNIFFTDTENNRVRRIDAITNIISTVAGNGETDFNQDNIAATKAALNGPFCISIDRAGNLFIADSGNNRIRKVNLQGIITTVAGNGDSDFSGDKDLATKAALSFPLGVFVDELGNLLIADSLNNRLRKVDATTQIISTIAGTGIDEYNGDQIPAVSASLNFPTRVSVDGEGNIFIADFINNRVRRIDAKDQTITTVAGNGDFNFDGDGKAATESALSPTEVIVDGFGNLFVTDQANNRIRYVEAQSKSIKTIAGNGKVKFDGDDALATSAVINPVALTFDNDGNLIIVDRFTNRIRKIEALTGMVTSIAGCARQIGTCPEDDGLASQVELSPSDIVVDSKGNILITEATRHRVRKLDIKTGLISTIAGNGRAGFSGDGSVATEALLNSPRGITLDKAENILIADLNNKRVRKIDQATGIISTIAGNGSDSPRGDGDLATKAAIKAPMSILLDSSENIFITDVISNIVRKIDKQTGVITTIAGKGCDPLIDMSNCLPGNGGSANLAGLNFPVDIVSDGSGDLFIVEALNNQIRKVNSSDGKINPVVGNGNLGFSGDGGLALASSLNLPLSLAVDKSGNIFIADFQNGRVRAVKNLARPGGMPSQAIISSASFAKNTLTISGSGFTISKAQVIVNDKDVSSLISSQLDNQILLQGNKKSLNIKKGANRITVIVNGVASNTFVLNKLTASID